MYRHRKNRLTTDSPPVERLEPRTFFSASIGHIQPQRIILPQAAPSTTVQGLIPSQIRRAYGFDQINFADGAMAADGQGQTIAIVDAFDDPSIIEDLNVFDTQFGLSAPPSFRVVSQTGTNVLPLPNADWASETSMDVEWAHAVAPGANILLVEANSDSANDLMAGENYARHVAGVSVISMSWGGSEIFSIKDVENTSQLHFDPQFTTPAGHAGVTFVAASGDTGAKAGVDWPASAPNVLSVGGTTLNVADSSGAYGSESGWAGSSGGYSQLEFEPSYQLGAQLSGKRAAPDVAYDADPNTGFAVYDSVDDNGFSGWQVIAGTSAGAPQWAGLIAIANQGRAFNGLGPLDGRSQTLPLLYNLYNAPGTAGYSTYASDFNDIISNGAFHRRAFGQATAGYDTVTGMGSPRVQNIMPVLIGQVVTPLSQSLEPITGSFVANPPNSVVAGSIGVLKLKMTDSVAARFSGALVITLFASIDGSLIGATPLVTIPIPLLNVLSGTSRLQTLRFTYPTSMVGTTQMLIATIDAPGTNTAPGQTVSTPVAIAVPTVDLAVSYKNAQPGVVKTNRVINEVLIIQNVGNVLAKGTFNLTVYAGALDVTVDRVVTVISNRKVNLQPGKFLTLQFHFKPTPDQVVSSFDITAVISSITQPADGNPVNDSAVVGTIASA